MMTEAGSGGSSTSVASARIVSLKEMLRRSTLYLLAVGCLLLTSLCQVPATTYADKTNERYFAASGHTLSDPFWTFWNGVPDPVRIFGYPISEPFVQASFSEPGQFFRVQFFERAVLEEQPVPLNAEPGHSPVVGRLLGTEMARGRLSEAPFLPLEGDPQQGNQWDPYTHHTLGDTPAPFLRFYDSYGGLPVFGRPLSEQFQEQNADTGETYWVQYFERQRFEWHPNEPDPSFQIQLGRLGDEFHAQHQGQLEPTAFTHRDQSQPPDPSFIYGVNATLYYTDHNRVAQTAADAGFGWVRQQVLWRDHQAADGTITWDELDQIVAAVHGAGMKLLLCVVQAPDWATGIPGKSGFPDAAHRPAYAAFLAAIATRYGPQVAGFEIWNEMNLASENDGRPVPETANYVDLLAYAYDAVKAVSPQTLIVSGGPGPTEWGRGRTVAISDRQFFAEMFANPRYWTHIDITGVHVFGYGNPPDTLWPDTPGPGPGWRESREFYFRRIEDIRALMVQTGHADRPLWMTEFGWATANDSPLHEFGNGNSFDQQAAYLVRAFQIGRHSYTPWLGAMFVWNLNFAVTWRDTGTPLHEQGAYGILNADWSPRPAYTALAGMPKP